MINSRAAQALVDMSRGTETLDGQWDLVVEISAQSLAELNEVLRRIRNPDGVVTSKMKLLLSTRRASSRWTWAGLSQRKGNVGSDAIRRYYFTIAARVERPLNLTERQLSISTYPFRGDITGATVMRCRGRTATPTTASGRDPPGDIQRHLPALTRPCRHSCCKMIIVVNI